MSSGPLPREVCHPPPGVPLRAWFGSAYARYAVLLQPLHPHPTHAFTPQERKSSAAVSWSEAAASLGWRFDRFAHAVHDHLDALAGAAPESPADVSLLRARDWSLPPEDHICSGVERPIGAALQSVSIRSVEASDEFGIERAEVSVASLCGPMSELQRIQSRVSSVSRLTAGDRVLFVSEWDWPHILVCERELRVINALEAVGAELVRLSPEAEPLDWWCRQRTASED